MDETSHGTKHSLTNLKRVREGSCLHIRKAVITAAGLGTRLLPATKEMPKEMLPLFYSDLEGRLMLKPVLQIIFEQLYDVGFREFCFIVGRGKRSVEDHFTPDYSYVNLIKRKGKAYLAEYLEAFYRKLESSTIIWINQPEPKGFGDAVLMSEPFVGQEPFLVHAGDTAIVLSVPSKRDPPIKRLINCYETQKTCAIITVKEMHEPKKIYGCAVVETVNDGLLKVKSVVEKPEKPPSKFAIMPIYIFDPVIFKALRQIGPGVGNEIQLTDAIQKLIEWNVPVYAVKLDEEEIKLDVGMPETYWEALTLSYELSTRRFTLH